MDPPWRLGQDWCLGVGLLEEAGEHSVVSPASSMHPRCCNRGVGTRPLPAARAHGKARAYNTGSMEGVL